MSYSRPYPCQCHACNSPFFGDKPDRKYCCSECSQKAQVGRTKTKFFQRLRECRRGPEECWLYPGKLDPAGYGRTCINNRKLQAHCLSYEHFVGKVPEGLELDHLCRNRACINPAHLEPVTAQVNVRRGMSFAAENAKKTHCPKGHAYSPENTRINVNGSRECRTCCRATGREFARAKARKRREANQATRMPVT